MSSTNLHIVIGRLGSDAKVSQPTENGRRAFRFSIGTDHFVGNGERQTCWISVVYWSGSDKEITYLTERLVTGALVKVHGPSLSRRYSHSEYPIEVQAWDLHAEDVTVLGMPQRERTTDAVSTHAPAAAPARATLAPAPASEPEMAPPPPATPARGPAPKLQF